MDTSAPVTPAITGGMEAQQHVNLDKLDFSGMPSNPAAMGTALNVEQPSAPPAQPTDPMQQPLGEAAVTEVSPTQTSMRTPFGWNQLSSSSSDAEDSSASNGGSPEGSFERVINVKNCPLCHRPRMNSKAEVDIVHSASSSCHTRRLVRRQREPRQTDNRAAQREQPHPGAPRELHLHQNHLLS